MKIFHWPNGVVANKALTVAELRELLDQYPPDMPVFAAWEGQYMPLGMLKDVREYSAGVDAERCECLVLDAEYGW